MNDVMSLFPCKDQFRLNHYSQGFRIAFANMVSIFQFVGVHLFVVLVLCYADDTLLPLHFEANWHEKNTAVIRNW